jgi:hypothetical protein
MADLLSAGLGLCQRAACHGLGVGAVPPIPQDLACLAGNGLRGLPSVLCHIYPPPIIYKWKGNLSDRDFIFANAEIYFYFV